MMASVPRVIPLFTVPLAPVHEGTRAPVSLGICLDDRSQTPDPESVSSSVKTPLFKTLEESKTGKKTKQQSEVSYLPSCDCGCGGTVRKKGNRFINGHQNNEYSPSANGTAKNPWTEYKPNKAECDAIWDALIEVLGWEPESRSDRSKWGMVVRSLASGRATPEKIRSVASWYRRSWPDVDLTITAIEKWYSHFLAMAEKREKKKKNANICPYCEMGGGNHSADCEGLASL